MSAISSIKSIIFPSGRKPRKIAFGLYGGLTFEIDPASGTQVLLGLWERETYKVIRTAAKRCDWAIDVGVGDGELVTYLLIHSGVRTVYGFEPSSECRNVAVQNLALNGLAPGDRFILFAKVCWCYRR